MSPEENKFIAELYEEYSESLWRYALVSLGNADCADELIADLFHDAAKDPSQVTKFGAPFPWLIGALRKKIKKYKQRLWKDTQRLLSLDEETLGRLAAADLRPTEDLAELRMTSTAEAQAKIEAALSSRELYILKRVTLNKATHKAVSEELGISVWRSQKCLERAREKLRKVFPGHAKEKKKK